MTSLAPPLPIELVDARLQLHHAAQIAASFGYTFVIPQPDWSHTSLSWSAKHGALNSSVARGIRVGLRLSDVTLLLITGDQIADTCSLDGETLESGYAWLKNALTRASKAFSGKDLKRPDHELPSHAVQNGASFSHADTAAFEVLARWFGFADSRLRQLDESHEHTTPVLCWPHHFDIARLVLLSADADLERDPSVGVGLIPGDETYTEPYWYVTHWPSPDNPDLPALSAGGRWHTKGWTGAVLPASQFAHLNAAVLTDDFMGSAIDASLNLIKQA